jgi:hypothetical protein
MAHRFEDFDVFQRAYKFSLEIHKMSLNDAADRTARGSRIKSAEPANRSAQIWLKGLASKANPKLNSGGSF